MSDAMMDNDVLLKATRYEVLHWLLTSARIDARRYHILGAARYIVRRKLEKLRPVRRSHEALEYFEAAVTSLEVLEPSREELRLAASLELAAQRHGLALDSGESQLCAALTLRQARYLLTGDKRAIRAIEVLISGGADIDAGEKLVCLEQLVLWILHAVGVTGIRDAICAQPDVDRALTTCFSCHSSTASADSCHDGLCSYINDLRRAAPSALLSEL